MLHWIRMVIAYKRAMAAMDDASDPLPLPASIAVFLPLAVIAGALLVLALRWMLGAL